MISLDKHSFVIPAKAGIQYSAVSLVITGSPPSRG